MRTSRQTRKYSEYRDDPDIRVPVVRWLMDKWLVYAAFTMAAIVMVAVTTSQGNASYRAITAAPKKNSPYQDIQAVDSPGMRWAKTLVAENPDNIKDWTPGTSSTPKHPLPNDTCKQEQVPSTVLAAYDATGKDVTVTVQVYGAGQAAKQFTTYKDGAWANCLQNMEQVANAKDNGVNAYKFDGGFLITAGDATLGAAVKDTGLRDRLLAHYVARIPATLNDFQCAALISTDQDATRSFYYTPSAYSGYKRTQVVHTKVTIKGNATPIAQQLKDIADTDAEQPEGPLPQGFPELPKEMQKPTHPDIVNDVDDFITHATYPIKDTSGPGCGWAWSSQKAPTYDEQNLAKTQNEAVTKAQNEADQRATDYMKNRHYYSGSMVTYLEQADSWNRYVSQVDAVHEKWTWLTTQRGLIESSWRGYVDEHNSWFTFDDRKQAAKTTYDREVLTCNTANEELKKWQTQYGDAWKRKQEEAAQRGLPAPSASPTPSASLNPTPGTVMPAPTPAPAATPTPTPGGSNGDIPAPPPGCTTPPVKPEILDQQKPAEPQPPTIPDGVTIPASWPQPNK